jgi:hypothetical protein
VFKVGFGLAAVAGSPDPGDGGGLADGGLGAGAAGVVLLPVVADLPGAGAGDDVVQLAGRDRQLAALAS